MSANIEAALRRAYHLGQTYWQQADSESYSQNKKADATQKRFDDLVAETLAALASTPSQEPVAWLHTLKQRDDEEEDQALSFSPDNFPLMDELPGMFQSIRHEPLYTAPPSSSQEAK